MTQNEFEALINDQTKRIVGNIDWVEDEDHSPSVEFRMDIESTPGYPVFVRGSYNREARAVTFALIHRSHGRIYGLDLGKDHHNPTCNNVGERHLHRWTEAFHDKEALAPPEVTATVDDLPALWRQFCALSRIEHDGELNQPGLPPEGAL